jgi:hypothetical protein
MEGFAADLPLSRAADAQSLRLQAQKDTQIDELCNQNR